MVFISWRLPDDPGGITCMQGFPAVHYENMPMEYLAIFTAVKTIIFR